MGVGRESQELRENLYVSWRKGGEKTKERKVRDQDGERKRERRKRKERERGRRILWFYDQGRDRKEEEIS